jgi:ribonucleoside-triphosphate reductase
VALQIVSVNLPRVGLLAHGDAQEVLSYVEPAMEVAAEAHLEKRVFVEGLMALGRRGPLGLLAGGASRPLLALDEAVHAIAPCGLNELTRLVTGEELHEGSAARGFAEDLLTHMARVAGALSRRRKLQFRVGLVAERGAALRFAGLDLRHHAPAMAALGDRMGHVRYTAGVGLREDLSLAPARRVQLEGEVGRPLQRPCPTRLKPGDLDSDPARLAEFFMHVYVHTRCREVQVDPREEAEA